MGCSEGLDAFRFLIKQYTRRQLAVNTTEMLVTPMISSYNLSLSLSLRKNFVVTLYLDLFYSSVLYIRVYSYLLYVL